MCVIAIAPNGENIEWDILQNAVERNPDGWGLTAISPGGAMSVAKGFGFTSAKKAWKKVSGLPRVFHARIGTSGTKDISNCHPFPSHTAEGQRWFFHNGTVSIPRFSEKMCDSWHLAQYIRQWAADETLHKALTEYAQGQSSRFVLVEGGVIHRYGKQWIQRGGVWYSNSSALAGIVRDAKGNWYEGGYMADKTVEVTSDTGYTGLNWDAAHQCYSNLAPEPVKKNTAWSADDWEAWGMGGAKHGPRYQPKKAVDLAPWFNTNWGTIGSQRSYPSMDEFNFSEEDHHLQLCSTHRRKTPKGTWTQVTFDRTGKWQGSEACDGPYENGLLIESGKSEVVYNNYEISIEGWIALVKCTFDMTEQSDELAWQMWEDKEEEMTSEKGTITLEMDEHGNEIVKVT